MTEEVNRRDMLRKRTDFIRTLSGNISSVGSDTVLESFPYLDSDVFSNDRSIAQLAMVRARKIVSAGLYSYSYNENETFLLQHGADMIGSLIMSAGVHVLWSDVIRIIQRSERDALDAELGLASRPIALRARLHDIHTLTLVPELDGGDGDVSTISKLPENIRREGAACWACWLDAQNDIPARCLRVLTPKRFVDLMPSELSEDVGERNRRCLLVDIELEAIMKVLADSSDVRENE